MLEWAGFRLSLSSPLVALDLLIFVRISDCISCSHGLAFMLAASLLCLPGCLGVSGWLLGWLIGWLVSWLAGWLVGRLVGMMTGFGMNGFQFFRVCVCYCPSIILSVCLCV